MIKADPQLTASAIPPMVKEEPELVSTRLATAGLFWAAAKVPASIAPEQAGRLVSELSGWPWDLKLVDGKANFYASVSDRTVKLSAAGLAALWNIAFVAFEVADAGTRTRSAAQKARGSAIGSHVMDITQHWHTNRLGEHISYAKQLFANDRAWPSDLARPSQDQSKVLNLCLGALGWLMLHEIGHVALEHEEFAASSQLIAQEHQADEFATQWVLSGAGNGLKREFRIMAINVAMTYLLLAPGAKGRSGTHPPSFQRVWRTIQEFEGGKRSVGLESSAYFLKAIFDPSSLPPTIDDASEMFDWVVGRIGLMFPR